MLNSLDLWQGKFANLNILVKALNIKDFIVDEVKIDAHLQNEDINVLVLTHKHVRCSCSCSCSCSCFATTTTTTTTTTGT